MKAWQIQKHGGPEEMRWRRDTAARARRGRGAHPPHRGGAQLPRHPGAARPALREVVSVGARHRERGRDRCGGTRRHRVQARRPRRDCGAARLRLCRGADCAGRPHREAAGRHRRQDRRLNDGARHDRALSLEGHLHGEARRHHRDPRRGRRRRPDRQPMGEASRRNRDRHGRQRRQGGGCERRTAATTCSATTILRRRCTRSPAARGCRWSTTRSAC